MSRPPQRREEFVAARQDRWKALETNLRRRKHDARGSSELARLYRAVAADLASAQSTDQPADIVAYLDDLASRAHNALYGTRRLGGLDPLRLLAVEFPRELRASWVFFLAASILFYGPFVVGTVGCLLDPSLAARVLPESQLEMMETMYSDAIGRGGSGEDAGMAGFYVNNNVGIAFRCFATGAFAGLGSLFFLVYNGAVLGTIEGYLVAQGKGWNLLLFTCGHSAWELTGIVVAGTAGLRLGWALLVTGGRTRAASLAAAGPVLFRLVSGCAAMLFVAAAIEGFWSASPIPWFVKLPFAAVQLVIVVLWLALGGRRWRPA
ncbi:MAG: stage II sporulation protein M [Alphaproteobacteria bacterium]|nr:stage II sporulation protein M [Alphaproteobacteria bacterium]